jgi:hypothetical protein
VTSATAVAQIESTPNDRPRKRLGDRTPRVVLANAFAPRRVALDIWTCPFFFGGSCVRTHATDHPDVRRTRAMRSVVWPWPGPCGLSAVIPPRSARNGTGDAARLSRVLLICLRSAALTEELSCD